MSVTQTESPAGSASPQAGAQKAAILALHENNWSHLLEHNLLSILWLSLVGGAIWTWQTGYWPLMIAIWMVGAHVGHMKLAAFHEASHSTLHTTGWRNDMQGMFVGTLVFIPLSVYRLTHWQH